MNCINFHDLIRRQLTCGFIKRKLINGIDRHGVRYKQKTIGGIGKKAMRVFIRGNPLAMRREHSTVFINRIDGDRALAVIRRKKIPPGFVRTDITRATIKRRGGNMLECASTGIDAIGDEFFGPAQSRVEIFLSRISAKRTNTAFGGKFFNKREVAGIGVHIIAQEFLISRDSDVHVILHTRFLSVELLGKQTAREHDKEEKQNCFHGILPKSGNYFSQYSIGSGE